MGKPHASDVQLIVQEMNRATHSFVAFFSPARLTLNSISSELFNAVRILPIPISCTY